MRDRRTSPLRRDVMGITATAGGTAAMRTQPSWIPESPAKAAKTRSSPLRTAALLPRARGIPREPPDPEKVDAPMRSQAREEGPEHGEPDGDLLGQAHPLLHPEAPDEDRDHRVGRRQGHDDGERPEADRHVHRDPADREQEEGGLGPADRPPGPRRPPLPVPAGG